MWKASLNHITLELEQEQDLEQEMDGRLLAKNTPNSTNRNRNIPPVGVNKMIDVDELPVNGRAVPLSNR